MGSLGNFNGSMAALGATKAAAGLREQAQKQEEILFLTHQLVRDQQALLFEQRQGNRMFWTTLTPEQREEFMRLQ